MTAYQRPPSPGDLRLHLNENTAGCSPRVAEALCALTRQHAAFYPDYDAAVDAAARRLGVAPANIVLTNGLDEGILLVALVGLRGGTAAAPFEAMVVEPAFDVYHACIDAVGGRLVTIPPEPDFSFPLERVLAAVTPATRVIFLTSPNNPTGISIPPDAVLAVARGAPDALVLLDEAYADFADATMIPQAAAGQPPNLVIGRTFAKAYGLAGLRVGALVADERTLAPVRRAVLPYTLNAFAAAALPVALADTAYYDWYLGEVRESKRLLYEALEARGVRFWPSDGNFVLACFGAALPEVVSRLAALGIAIRDRSKDPGCAGCARITAGVVAHTRRLLDALEEVPCGAR